jgi:hypothetical protein
MSEMFERNLFHRSAPQSAGKPGVVNDASTACIDPMVAVERAPPDEVRAERRLLPWTQARLAKEDASLTLGGACIDCAPDHMEAAYAAAPSQATQRWSCDALVEGERRRVPPP